MVQTTCWYWNQGVYRMINTLIKWGLRVFAFGHMIEFFLAIYEVAYMTATAALIFGIFDYIASYYIQECECD